MDSTHTNTLYLVRHGENLANITHEFSYKRVDYSFTPKGVLQAEQTAAFFEVLSLDAVYASPLKRAFETGEIIARPHGLPVIVLEEFREVNVGDLELMPPTAESWNVHDEIVAGWANGHKERRFPGGENFLEMVDRARHGLLEVTRGRSGQRIVIAAHGGILSAVVRNFCEDPSADRSYVNMHNCAITEIELTTSRDTIIRGSVSCWARVAHLSGEAATFVSPVLEDKEAQKSRVK